MSEQIYQFKITLNGPKPQVWRQIQVPGSYNFHQLHVAIQKAMGWESVEIDYHLHNFGVMNPETFVRDSVMMADDLACYQDLGDDGHVKNENNTKITDYFKVPGDMGRYLYDFGMGWGHQVLLEKILPLVAGEEYPKCIAQGGKCPREDGRASSDEEGSEEFEEDEHFEEGQEAAGEDNKK